MYKLTIFWNDGTNNIEYGADKNRIMYINSLKNVIDINVEIM